ncbi:MAG: hypothetical protein JNM17_29905 [Archangium sp.]|nr:hypothetical protein [Archangium sp.]
MNQLALAVLVLTSSLSLAQPLRNRIEKAKDRQDLRQDNRQLANDRFDAARAMQMLRDYDAAAAVGDVVRLGGIDVAFNGHIAREIQESKVESAQARQEIREDKRELASDRREVRQPGNTLDDVKDKNRDRINLADDKKDARQEFLSRERLQSIQGQLAGLAGRFDAPSVAQKRALYAEVAGAALKELSTDKQERREDRRELREDKKETKEDRWR